MAKWRFEHHFNPRDDGLKVACPRHVAFGHQLISAHCSDDRRVGVMLFDVVLGARPQFPFAQLGVIKRAS